MDSETLTILVIASLCKHDCTRVRRGGKYRGRPAFDIWHSPKSGKNFPVDSKILSRHTANAIMKQAGLPKEF
jgi:hypothetical protein